jgi:hypothetical protein
LNAAKLKGGAPMRQHPLARQFGELRGGTEGGLGLLFLHELSSVVHPGVPPPEARSEEIVDAPADEIGEAIDRARDACLACWPDQLEGFFSPTSYADESTHVLEATIKKLVATCEQAPEQQRASMLGDVHQALRGLTSKQALGAFFTPWTLAVFLARMAGTESGSWHRPDEQWVVDPARGAGVLLHAYLNEFRAAHGPRAARAVTMIGVDIDPRVSQLARATLLLAGADANQFWIFHGNSLAREIVGRDRSGTLRTLQFSVTVGNPPFRQKESLAALTAEAADGPLIVPEHVLHRFISNPHAAPTAAAGKPRRPKRPGTARRKAA